MTVIGSMGSSRAVRVEVQGEITRLRQFLIRLKSQPPLHIVKTAIEEIPVLREAAKGALRRFAVQESFKACFSKQSSGGPRKPRPAGIRLEIAFIGRKKINAGA